MCTDEETKMIEKLKWVIGALSCEGSEVFLAVKKPKQQVLVWGVRVFWLEMRSFVNKNEVS